MFQEGRSLRIWSFVAVCLVVWIYLGVGFLEAQSTPAPGTKMAHVPIRFFVSGFRIRITAQVADPIGIMLVRCYFRAKGEADYVFVDMPRLEGDKYEALLPAPSPNTVALEYILLAVNNNRVVVRSQVFTVYRTEGNAPPEWQSANATGQITVKTELAQAPKVVAGFTDNIVADIVESAFRFGYVVEGIYLASQIGSAELPVKAVNGGTITATPTLAAASTSGGAGAAQTIAGKQIVSSATAGVSAGKVLLWIGIGALAIGATYLIIKAISNKSTTSTTTTTIPRTTTTTSTVSTSTTTTTIPGGSGYEFDLKWGSQGSGNGQFNIPNDISIDSAGNIYVVESNNNRVQKFASSGSYLTKWGSGGSGDGQFSTPGGLGIDAGGNVYVAGNNDHRIQKFDSSGTFLSKWGQFGTGNGQFSNPWDVATDFSGSIYVADSGNHRIQKFTSSGGFLTKWGSNGTGGGQFNCPYGIAIDNAGYVYVADSLNNRIQKFDSSGNFITQWGSLGTNNGQFNCPRRVAVDNLGNVFVADTDNHRIQKFSSNGAFIVKWGSQGSGDGQFQTPWGLVIDSSGRVYVADAYNYRIQRFRPTY